MTQSRKQTDVRNLRWVADQGSVYTEQVFEKKTDAGVFVKARISVAFNVGDEVAQHMVKLHNGMLAFNDLQQAQVAEQDAMASRSIKLPEDFVRCFDGLSEKKHDPK